MSQCGGDGGGGNQAAPFPQLSVSDLPPPNLWGPSILASARAMEPIGYGLLKANLSMVIANHAETGNLLASGEGLVDEDLKEIVQQVGVVKAVDTAGGRRYSCRYSRWV